jgi:hypothetical protein
VGRNNHQSMARRSGRRADVTDHRSYLHAVSPAATVGNGPDLSALRRRPAAAAGRCHWWALRDGSAWRRGSLHRIASLMKGTSAQTTRAAVRAKV